MITEFTLVQGISGQPLQRCGQQRASRTHPRVVGAADQPRTQYLRQRPSLRIQADGALLAHQPLPGGLCGARFPQDLMKSVDRRPCHVRLRTRRHDLVTVGMVAVVG
ncbi:MAG: hypothetical protein ACRD0H_04750, partial [Actinomycetes bacterium]